MRPVTLWLTVALAATACTQQPPPVPGPPVTTGLPTASRTSTTPTASPTPNADDLVRQAQAAYQVAFDEYERLAWAGASKHSSPRLTEVATSKYLQTYTQLLEFQDREGIRIEGQPSKSKSRPSPGPTSEGSDPRMTIEVCEDRSGSTAVMRDGSRERNVVWQGLVYSTPTGSRAILTGVDTRQVTRCSW